MLQKLRLRYAGSEKIKEIRLSGRGGQGIVIASEIIVHAAMIDGLYGHSIPSFGTERRGSPVLSSVRIDDRPIREKTLVYLPDCIIASDPTLLGPANVFAGIREGAIMVLNSSKEIESVDLPPQITRVGIVNATKIAFESLGIPVTNTVMVGAFAVATGWVRVSSTVEAIRQLMPAELVQRNVEASRRGAEEIRILDIRRDH